MGKIICFGDIHVHHTHKFSKVVSDGFTTRELEHLSCADRICELVDKTPDCERVVFLGDMFGPVGDNVSCQCLMVVTEIISKIQQKCLSRNIPFDLIVGNHDVSSYLNNKYSHKLYPFKNYAGVNIYDQPTEKDGFVYMPYCNSDEYATNYLENVDDKENKVVFSHLELKYIDLGLGITTGKGVDPSVLEKFKMTISGHYHNGVNYSDKILICGSTQRLSFKDKGIARNNIIIYDKESNSITRDSFNCPDWLTFTDENITDILKIDDNNYVDVEVTLDQLITPEIEQKLSKVKDKTVVTAVKRISLDMDKIKLTSEIRKEDNLAIVKRFIEETEESSEDKENLLNEGIRLLNENSTI